MKIKELDDKGNLFYREMTFEEYKKAVYQECLQDGYAKTHENNLKKTFNEELADIEKDFNNGVFVGSCAWGLCLLLD